MNTWRFSPWIFLFIASFEFLTEENKGMDWLSDWKEIRKGGAQRVKEGIKKEKAAMLKKKAAADQVRAKKVNAGGAEPKKSEPIPGEYREVIPPGRTSSADSEQHE